MAQRNNILVSRTLYQLSILTLITATIWVGIGVYRAIAKPPTEIQVDQSIIEPINVTLDKDVVNLLANRIKIEGELATPSASPKSSTKPVIAPDNAQINVVTTDEIVNPELSTPQISTSGANIDTSGGR